MSEEIKTENNETFNLTEEKSKITFRVPVHEGYARTLLEELGLPIPNEMPDEIHIIIQPEK